MQWLAGMRLTADRMNDNTVDETTIAGATAASGFTSISFSGRKLRGITTITVIATRNGGTVPETSAGSGNIGDTTMCTLPAGWRPPELIEAIWDSGFNDGGATINTSGTVVLRTTSGSNGILDTQSPRITASWISEND